MSSSNELNNRKLWEKWKSKENNFLKNSKISSPLIYGTPAKAVPDVSIMIITYKRADGLREALESAIKQDYSLPYEIAVVDDSGFDSDTDELMKEYCSKYPNIMYYRNEENLGQYANWNRACELCRTQWYCLLHDDDMMKSQYLTMCMAAKSGLPSDVGLIGSYMETVDKRSDAASKTLIDKLVDLFIRLRKNKPIHLTTRDNIRHIFVLSCCLFINRDKVIDVGGLDDAYFPSSDFVLASKMNIYHKIVFLPTVLSMRGIGENESLKKSVCNDSIAAAYNLTTELAKEIWKNTKVQKRKASIAAVIAEIGVKGYNDVDYSQLKMSLGMSKTYCSNRVVSLINIYSKLNWGLLLLRR